MVKVATAEQQQWTDRLDISNTVDSASEFRVAAAATADAFFFFGFRFLNLVLENPVRKLAAKMFDRSLVILCLSLNRK